MKKYWRLRTPLQLQMQSMECGAASLGMILGYYGKTVSLSELRERCNVSRDGSNTYDIIEAAADYGLIGEGYQKSVSELEELRAPAILFWDFTHFLVLEGFSEKLVYLNDPAVGRVAMSREEFKEHYSGIALLFKKGEQFQPSKKRERNAVWSAYKGSLLYFFLFGITLLLPTLVVPVVFRVFVDHHYSDVLLWRMEWLTILLFSIVYGALMHGFYLHLINKISSQVVERIRSKVVWKLLQLPLSFYHHRNSSEVASRVELVRSMSDTILKKVFPTIVLLFLSLIYAALMFTFSPFVASITLCGALGSLLFMFLIYRSERPLVAFANREAEKNEMLGIVGISNMEWIKAAGAEGHYFTEWAGSYAKSINRAQNVGVKGTALQAFPFFIQLLSTGLLIGVGGEEIASGNLSLGMLIYLQILLILFLAPLKNFIQAYGSIKQAFITLTKVDDIFDAEVDVPFKTPETSGHKESLRGEIEFKNVTFGYYTYADPEIADFSLKIKAGSWVAFTGRVSSGKSTLGKLAASLIYPWKGEVLYDGLRWDQIERAHLRKSIGWVSQHTFIFSGTFRDNITLWDTSISEEEVEQACRLAMLHERILSKPKKYHEWIAEDGKNISYSERQQIEIARAFLKKPVILVIDEGMNAISPDMQKKIMENLRTLNCTAIFITYQEFVQNECDQIVQIAKGKILHG